MNITPMSDNVKHSPAADLHSVNTLVSHHTSITVVPAVRVHISEHSDHVVTQSQRLEGGGDDDVASLCEHSSQKHCPSVDVGGGLDTLLGQDVVHPILPVQLHLGEEKHLGFI